MYRIFPWIQLHTGPECGRSAKRNILVRFVCMFAAAALLLYVPAAASSGSGASSPSIYFSFEGGSGKLKISCEEVELRDGAAYAALLFSSTHIPYITKDGVQYELENQTVTIPVTLDEWQTITVLTTAMSEPHEIDYSIYVSLSGEDTETKTSGSSQTGDSFASGLESPAELVQQDDGPAPIQQDDGAALIQQDDGAALIQQDDAASGGQESQTAADTGTLLTLDDAPLIEGLTLEGELSRSYAQHFSILNYSGGYQLILTSGGGRYFLIPEGAKCPEGIPADLTVIRKPVASIYLAAPAAMSLIDAIGGISSVTMTGTSQDKWYIDAPIRALQEGSMVYAGKYSEPDYELLLQKGCDLTVESRMILHTPKVKEMIEDLQIPVLVDVSSLETTPLGRTEWVKLYGALLDREDAAEDFFAEQEKLVEDLEDLPDTQKTAAFFSINLDGSVVVRTDYDYIPSMIDLAGGTYLFSGMDTKGSTSSTSAVSMEEFYSIAVDADYLIYNATIEDPLGSIQDLINKNGLFEEFRAVRNHAVYQVDRKAYQSTDKLAYLILDFHTMFTDGDSDGFTFLEQLQ